MSNMSDGAQLLQSVFYVCKRTHVGEDEEEGEGGGGAAATATASHVRHILIKSKVGGC
jgi:hypothetical protein